MTSPALSQMAWPDGKRFAFTIFDDPDSQTWEAGREIYALLDDLGIHTTKGIWPMAPIREPSDHGVTCGLDGYADWLKDLAKKGFEIGYHNATSHTCDRAETQEGLERFRATFGHYPLTMAQHYYCDENLYWGDGRVSGWRRFAYNVLTRFKNHSKFFGDKKDHPYFWGDLCRERITYCRSFTFREVNTLKAWRNFPYHDPKRSLVRYWFISSEGSNRDRFCQVLSEANQERLEAEGGLCLMYTHFGHGYYSGAINGRFVELMRRLSARPGWFAPVGQVLDYMRQQQGELVLNDAQRRRLEQRWLGHKLFYGTA